MTAVVQPTGLQPRREGEKELKWCSGCEKDLPIELFRLTHKWTTKYKRNRKVYRYHRCKVCQNRDMNYPKKKSKAKDQIRKNLSTLDERIIMETIAEDPDFIKVIVGRIGAQRYERIKAKMVQKTLIEILERRVRQCKTHGLDTQETFQVWRDAVKELGFTVPPERLLPMERWGLLSEEIKEFCNGNGSYLQDTGTEAS